MSSKPVSTSVLRSSQPIPPAPTQSTFAVRICDAKVFVVIMHVSLLLSAFGRDAATSIQSIWSFFHIFQGSGCLAGTFSMSCDDVATGGHLELTVILYYFGAAYQCKYMVRIGQSLR